MGHPGRSWYVLGCSKGCAKQNCVNISALSCARSDRFKARVMILFKELVCFTSPGTPKYLQYLFYIQASKRTPALGHPRRILWWWWLACLDLFHGRHRQVGSTRGRNRDEKTGQCSRRSTTKKPHCTTIKAATKQRKSRQIVLAYADEMSYRFLHGCVTCGLQCLHPASVNVFGICLCQKFDGLCHTGFWGHAWVTFHTTSLRTSFCRQALIMFHSTSPWPTL